MKEKLIKVVKVVGAVICGFFLLVLITAWI